MVDEIPSSSEAKKQIFALRVTRLSAILSFGFAVGVLFFQRSQLVDPIPTFLTFLGATGGALLGCWCGYVLDTTTPTKNRPFHQAAGLLVIPILAIFVGTLLVRSLVVQSAFWGLDPTVVPTEFRVESSSRRCRYGACFINLRLTPESRLIRVSVDRSLKWKVGPARSFSGDCIKLDVQTGRWGYRRVNVPNIFDQPLGRGSYRRCGASGG